MRGWRGFLGGILGLSVLYALTSDRGSKQAGNLFDDIAGLIARGMDRISNPNVAGLRDFRQAPLKEPAYKFEAAGGPAPKEPASSWQSAGVAKLQERGLYRP